MGDKDDYLTSYRVFFENFAATVNPEDQLPVNIAGYTITEAELPGEVIYWTTQYLTEKQCPPSLMTPLRRIILEEVRTAAKNHPNDFGFRHDESAFVALQLMQAVMARVNAVCLRYLDNSQLDSLPPPALLERDLRTVASATKNLRRVMEDRHVVIGNLEALFGIEATEPTSFYAVYDGHAGSAAATYCAAHLHQYLVESPYFQMDLRRAMQEAFLRTDEEFVRKSNQKRACGGSTAVAVVVRGQTLLAAWAGDSLALLTKRMRLMQLVHPHKPNRQDERERIESSGGTIMYYGTWRVNGQLAVSRAIGDAKYKPYVTAKPEIALVELDGDEDFVVVACDGLWDFVSEDKVALSIYAQLVADPDDLKAVTKRLIAQAKQEGSPDNITVIVVFLKDPRDIVAFINHPPMDLGLDNALSNALPFATEAEGRKLDAVAMAIDDCGDVEADADNGVSDSDSEDFGPETAVDVDDVDDADGDQHEPAPPTPPAHAVEAGHVDGVLVDNVAESGEESEDEWNYYKGEGEPERDEQNPSEEADEPPRSDTPCQDNSAWESSSVDMNSSPLNPDAPVFVPGGVAGSDVLLAESPRKPLPMDDIELPDVAQFQTEAVIRPAELLNLDNSDHLNGHHNMSIDATTEQMNGNGKCNMDSLGFGFNVNEESDKMKDTSLIKEFERIQKDTTDYCDIQVQVFQAHTETNPFDERDDELFERLKNKERDPMSMSFYQEKDDDTCERFTKIEGHIDLNAVQPLPDSDDEDIQQNGAYDITIQNEKENVPPEQSCLFEQVDVQEPNNDILKFDDRTENVVSNGSNVDNFEDYNINNTNNMQSYSNVEFECNNISQDILQTDTPESHKLLFEQIPEIPDGKSSELGFTNDDLQDCSESDKDIRVVTPDDEISQDIESKSDESPIADTQTDFIEADIKDDSEREKDIQLESDSQADDSTNELILENITDPDQPELIEDPVLQSAITDQTQAILHQIPNELKNIRDSHEIAQTLNHFVQDTKENIVLDEIIESKSNLIEAEDLTKTPSIEFKAELGPSEEENIISKSPLPSESPALSPIPGESPLPVVREITSSPMLEIKSPIPNNELLEDLVATSPLPTQSPLPSDSTFEQTSPVPQDDGTLSPLPAEVPLPRESPLPSESPLPREIQCLEEDLPCESTTSVDADLVPKSPLPVESPEPNSLASTTGLLVEASSCAASPLITNDSVLPQSPIPGIISVQDETSTEEQKGESPLPIDNDTLEITEDLAPSTQTLEINEEILHVESPPPGDLLQPSKSPLPTEQLITKSPLPTEEPSSLQTSSLQSEIVIDEMLLPVEEDHLSKSPLPQELVSEQKLPLCEELSQPTEPFVVNETQLLSETQVDAQPASPVKTEESFETSHHLESTPELISQNTTELLMEKEVPSDSPVPSISPIPVESTETVTSLIDNFQQLDIEDKVTELICESRLTPQETVQEHLESSSVTQPETILVETSSGPTPDLVPDERIDFPQTRNELITDIDIGIPESRAQEICVPVTSEIQQDDVVEPSAGTPPPTPAVEPVQVAPTTLDIPLLSETPMAGDTETLAAVSATAGVAAVAAAAATVAAKSKTPATKKSPTTPTTKTLKPAPKSTAATPRTPASAVKKTATASPAAKTLSATKLSVTKTPLSAKTTPTLKATPKTSMSPSKPATPISKAAAKPTLAAVKEAPAVAKTAPAAGARPATRAPAKPTNAKPIPSAPKTGTTAAKPLAPRSTARPAATRLSNTSTAAPPATKPKEAKPKTSAPKPLANGDVKPATKSAPKPAVTARPAAKPAPKPAPRTATAALPGNAVPAKPTAPRAAARVPLDKQSKDLANKRITAKSAPPRTAPAKVPIGAKSTSAKTGPKKVELPKKEVQENGLSNGAAPVKLPPSPPPADNALLPDVIA